jgi:hypothetical protein
MKWITFCAWCAGKRAPAALGYQFKTTQRMTVSLVMDRVKATTAVTLCDDAIK